MKLSNSKIVNDSAKLSEIAQKELPVKVSYAIAKNISKIESELKIYNLEREKLIAKYSIKDENGKTVVSETGQISLRPEEIVNWNKDMAELLAIENDVDIHQFSIEVLSGYNMSAADLMVIDYMIEE